MEVGLASSKMARKRDVEKVYPRKDFIAKLRRLAGALERGERFTIQVAGRRVVAPRWATVSVEHERQGGTDEIEFQITWKTAPRGARKVNP